MKKPPEKPPEKTPGMEPRRVVELISRIRELANIFIEDELASCGVEGVAPAHGGVLGYLLRQDEPVPIKDLVAFTGRAKSTITGVIQTLERHGYVERSGEASDNRLCPIRLTAKGRALKEDFGGISRRLVEAVYGEMPQADRETLMRLLGQVKHNLDGRTRERSRPRGALPP